LLAVGKSVGFEGDYAPRVASGLGGGIGHEGELCGALTGGVLAVSLHFGSDDPQDNDAKAVTYERSAEYVRRFAMANGAKRCRKLTGVNLRSAEGREAFRLLKVKEHICHGVLRNAVRQVLPVIEME
jgi:C_GCAxxG_C_C family probable redox protein